MFLLGAVRMGIVQIVYRLKSVDLQEKTSVGIVAGIYSFQEAVFEFRILFDESHVSQPCRHGRYLRMNSQPPGKNLV